MDHLAVTLTDGRPARATPWVTPLGYLTFTVTAEDGEKITNGWLTTAEKNGVPADRRPTGRTHLISGSPAVWFTPAEAEQLDALGEAALAAFAETPRGQELERIHREREEWQRNNAARLQAATAALHTPDGEHLAARRRELVTRVDALAAAESAERTAAHDDPGGDPGLYYRDRKPVLDRQITDAETALAEFDREHPEILAALRAEREDNVRRWAEL